MKKEKKDIKRILPKNYQSERTGLKPNKKTNDAFWIDYAVQNRPAAELKRMTQANRRKKGKRKEESLETNQIERDANETRQHKRKRKKGKRKGEKPDGPNGDSRY